MFSQPLVISLCPTEWHHLVCMQNDIFCSGNDVIMVPQNEALYSAELERVFLGVLRCCIRVWLSREPIIDSVMMIRRRGYWFPFNSIGVRFTSCVTQITSTLNTMDGRPREERKRIWFLRTSKIFPPKNIQIPPYAHTERTSTWHSKRKTKLPENCARNRKHENNENLSGTHVFMFVFSGR